MWEQPFAAQVEARLGVPVTIANDGKCAAAAEGWTGALAGVENGLVLVLGTGHRRRHHPERKVLMALTLPQARLAALSRIFQRWPTMISN